MIGKRPAGEETGGTQSGDGEEDGMAYDELRTARLVLRPWQERDREPFAAMNADPVVMEHFPAPLSRAQSDAYVDRIEAHFAEHGYGDWVVESDGVFAGYTGLQWQLDLPFGPALEVGWRLATPFWGRGIATEAARAAVGYGLDREPSIVSVTALTNERSWRVMERLGMRRDGEFDHPRIEPGHRLRRHYVYRTP